MAILIIYSSLVAVAAILFVLCGCYYESLPQIFDRRQYIEWKRVMSFKYYHFGEVCSYMENGVDWHVNIYFEEDPDCICTIFSRYGKRYVLVYDEDEIVFSSFWEKHAQKIIDKFMPEIEKQEITHL